MPLSLEHYLDRVSNLEYFEGYTDMEMANTLIQLVEILDNYTKELAMSVNRNNLGDA